MKDTDLQVGAILVGPSGQQWRITNRRELSESETGFRLPHLFTTIALQGIAPDGTPLKRRILRSMNDLSMKLGAGSWRLLSKGAEPF